MVSEATTGEDGCAPDANARPTAAPAPKRILFVDDEPALLEGLKDALRPFRRAWRVDFVSGGENALAALAEEPADVVIADMHMPGMDGVTLLGHVHNSYPTTIRIVLSGHPDPRVLARTAAVAHRFLGKPCNVTELSTLIERSCELRELVADAEAYRATAAATNLPSRPGLYTHITQAMADPSWGPAQIAELVERDTATTAKVLQLANSAFFGIGRKVSSVRDAVVYLGADTIRSLTLTIEAFGKFGPKQVKGFSLDEFQRHAMLVAAITRGILPTGRAQEEALTAALLHDIGKLVLIADDPRRRDKLTAEARERELPLYEVELEREGVTHAATGAYLLSLSGPPGQRGRGRRPPPRPRIDSGAGARCPRRRPHRRRARQRAAADRHRRCPARHPRRGVSGPPRPATPAGSLAAHRRQVGEPVLRTDARSDTRSDTRSGLTWRPLELRDLLDLADHRRQVELHRDREPENPSPAPVSAGRISAPESAPPTAPARPAPH